MKSMANKKLFFSILLFIIFHSTFGRDLNQDFELEDQLINDGDVLLHNKLDVRSVLWPKICFKTLLKRSVNEYPSDENQLHEHSQHFSKRNLRKCYPFDTT
ncbi:unnamed protein product [Rotaria socialis]|nr:unnamed protein product [Rotaria socialis]